MRARVRGAIVSMGDHDKNDDGDSDGGSGTTNPQDGDHWEDEDD
ncbi:hypothetical protein PP631_gp114 [Streptomyces phage KimJongPhill]|uniref:Uncharacterized protein n=1 Tax=Streptomyces phage KimJongPhill TaxID=2848886 RepID=A0A8F2E6U0_9CAUD|nr:hypothetical protein PP631_gp114 [Streptomyces phage KimJongPhill]QWT29893.1 hypothetical protein SEA_KIMJONGPHILL_113 [Streptomyces phage KimJongPhill]